MIAKWSGAIWKSPRSSLQVGGCRHNFEVTDVVLHFDIICKLLDPVPHKIELLNDDAMDFLECQLTEAAPKEMTLASDCASTGST